MRAFFILACFFSGIIANGQERCSTPLYSESQPLPAEISSTIQSATAVPQGIIKVDGSALETSLIIKIPVVVHVLYNNASQNISDAQIKSQLTVLNNDFRRRNADTVNTPAQFKSIAADVQIEFYLATSDPDGNATTGIIRKESSINYWMPNDRMKFSAQGGDNAWDRKSYLNIWVCNLVSGQGYSSIPGCDGAKDGVVINVKSFGPFSGNSGYNGGRTAVHEVGHWLGLRHIWGDTSCGDDGVSDTPSQSWYTQGCQSGFRSSCNNGTTGDMYMNYMDYTYDACVNLFTQGQRAKMRSLFNDGGQRASILTSKGLAQPVAKESGKEPFISDAGTNAKLYPNPATADITFNGGTTWVGKKVAIINANGAVVSTIEITTSLQKISINALTRGLYFIKGEGSLLEKFIKL